MGGVRVTIMVGLAGLLAGCLGPRPPGGMPVPPACAGRQPPAAADPAAAMVALARAEWRAWGERVIELRPGAQVLTLPDDRPQPWEQERPAFARLAAYWCATPPYTNYWALAARAAGFATVQGADGGIDGTAFNRLAIGNSPFNAPWSAAFTSWLVWGAGVPAARFRFSDTHWDYIADIMTAPPGSRAFAAHAAAAYAPRPGDLVCATRAGPPLGDWRRLLEGTRPMHCDLVVGTRACAAGRCLEAIGGNVLQAVSLTLAPVDAAGRLSPTGARNWIVVLEALAGPPRP